MKWMESLFLNGETSLQESHKLKHKQTSKLCKLLRITLLAKELSQLIFFARARGGVQAETINFPRVFIPFIPQLFVNNTH